MCAHMRLKHNNPLLLGRLSHQVSILLAAFMLSEPVLALKDTTLSLSGTHRLRYESMHHGPRPDAPASDEILVSRLFVSADLESGPFFAKVEMQDSRGWLHGAATPIGTDDINALEPIQAHVGWRGGDELPLEVTLGRITKNVTTRRLVARNRYRNTTNSFTGLDVNWLGEQWSINAFVFRPVLRLPSDRAALERNAAELDETSPEQRFWGVELMPAQQRSWSAHIFGLNEDDHPDYPTRNRQLITLGGQWRQFDRETGWHHAGELGLQWGESRLTSAASDTRDLDHRAWFMHAELGHKWRSHWSSRISIVADYASGDRRIGDASNERFDNLYGARRFDFGPTGIYGPQGRSNMLSPGLRWDAQPSLPTSLMVSWRGFWLAQPIDSHAGTGYTPLEGERYIGQQVEARVRQRLTEHFQLEAGAAYLKKGELLQSDAFSMGDTDSTYLYLQTTIRF